jgi:2-polyprenyl-6-methoxyphenol hydroxylase-like FAD-dependent oxidoreductase
MFGRHKRTQAVVVGAGPVGLLTALWLTRRGIAVSVVDQAWRAAGRSYAAAIHPASLALLDELGLAQEVLGAAFRVDRVELRSGAAEPVSLSFDPSFGKYPFIAVLPQSSLESLLERELGRRGVTVAWFQRVADVKQGASEVTTEVEVLEAVPAGYAVASTAVEVTKTLTITSDFVIGADGHRSVVRRALDVNYNAVGELEVFDVFEFAASDAPVDPVTHVALHGATSNVLWTLPNGRRRWSFQVQDPKAPPRLREKSRLSMALPGESSPRYTAERLAELVRERAPWFESGMGDIAWAGEVAFERRLAKRFGAGRVWLVGDSAHQTGPVGVQSMNAGLLEARELADAVADRILKNADPSVLEDYEQRAVNAWCRQLGLEAGYRAGEASPLWVREALNRIVPCVPATGDHLTKLLAQLGVDAPAAAPWSRPAR